jgi:hypothetical protein
MSKITRGLAIAADRKLSAGGAAAWSVEAADEQVRRLNPADDGIYSYAIGCIDGR